ncbi:aldehyde dehydrogenase family protein [Vagococcus salmoninarum]|uniref:Acetaldehyde dehydrogenase n=1 Tax=Vagococcus salmoninarum TaxID=2739 RepID=A0A429ZER3_9ENTE|nr:aldehyde dehydrogenase family protein [Vagococcus salmoninarum]RST92167.1 acetaldehyde dehydrogenase [Vagococcus salmoninarum]
MSSEVTQRAQGAEEQVVTELLEQAKLAQAELGTYSQDKIDRICKTVSHAAYDNRVKLAKLAQEETNYGRWQDKVIKNTFASKDLLAEISELPTVGQIAVDEEKKVAEIAVPVGVIAALVPVTNPTSTVIYKTLIALKSGNSIVFSPHPQGVNCVIATVKILRQAIASAGGPPNSISVLTKPTLASTSTLMNHDLTKLILATGSAGMVKAAYSSGNPAIGVGPGNSPAFIEKSANIALAVERIIASKTFDNSLLCSSEQSVIVEESSKVTVIKAFERQGGYFLSSNESQRLRNLLVNEEGHFNRQVIGQSALKIAELANITLPLGTKVLMVEESDVGWEFTFSREKLAPILAFYTVSDEEAASELAFKLLTFQGQGHTMAIHSEQPEVVKKFSLKMPVSRIIVNAGSALGAVGGTTALMPAMTLGCGAVGGSSSSDNIGPEHLFNRRRVAYGLVEQGDLMASETIEEIMEEGPVKELTPEISEEIINKIVKAVLAKL